MRLGKIIRAYRLHEERGLREVAKEIGVNASTLVRIEQGLACDSGTLVLVMHWLWGNDTDVGGAK